MTSQPCDEFAVYERFWPGKDPDFVCVGHAIDSARIGAAIDCKIFMRPITVTQLIELDLIPGEFPKCVCSTGHPQEINMVGYEKQEL